MRIALLIVGLCLLVPSCREHPDKADCQKMANKRANLVFQGKTGRNMQRAKKSEVKSSFEECMANYSKKEAKCVANAKNRNAMISCR